MSRMPQRFFLFSGALTPSFFPQQEEDTERGQDQGEGIRSSRDGDRGRLYPSEVPVPLSTIDGSITIQHLLPEPVLRNPYPGVRPGNRGEVTDHQDGSRGGFPFTEKADNTLFPVSKIDPFKPLGDEVLFIQGRMDAVEVVQVSDPALYPLVERRLEEMPVEAGVVIPLLALPEFPSHEEELFAGMAVHIAKEQTEIGEPLPVLSGHFPQEGPLAVDDLIMR